MNDFDDYRIAFYVTKRKERVRQVIAIDGFYVNALERRGIKKKDIAKWVQKEIDAWTAFDALLPITRQVKFLIVSFISL